MPLATPPEARVFLADTGAFDAAHYSALASDGGEVDWAPAVASIERTYGAMAVAPSPTMTPAPTLATHGVAPPKDKDIKENKEKDAPSRPFYASPWFWGAIGAAALGGTALYFATRDNSPSTIHLQLQVPK
jgi:hypothetical protein